MNASVSDYRVASSGKLAVMVAGMYDSARFRAMGRIYRPRGLGGSGWSPAGSDFTLLDRGSSQIANVAAAVTWSE